MFTVFVVLAMDPYVYKIAGLSNWFVSRTLANSEMLTSNAYNRMLYMIAPSFDQH